MTMWNPDARWGGWDGRLGCILNMFTLNVYLKLKMVRKFLRLLMALAISLWGAPPGLSFSVEIIGYIQYLQVLTLAHMRRCLGESVIWRYTMMS